MNELLERVIKALENAKGEPTIVHAQKSDIDFTTIYHWKLIYNNLSNEWLLVVEDKGKEKELAINDYGESWFIDEDSEIESFDRNDCYKTLEMNSWKW